MRTSMFHIVEAGEQLPFSDQYQYVQCAMHTVCLQKTPYGDALSALDIK